MRSVQRGGCRKRKKNTSVIKLRKLTRVMRETRQSQTHSDWKVGSAQEGAGRRHSHRNPPLCDLRRGLRLSDVDSTQIFENVMDTKERHEVPIPPSPSLLPSSLPLARVHCVGSPILHWSMARWKGAGKEREGWGPWPVTSTDP
jgi:hypothetical protein